MPRLLFSDDRSASWRDLDGIETVAKDEDSIVSYTLDWTVDLAGDTISSSSWTVDGVTTSANSNTTTTTTIKISGTDGTAKNKVVTAAGNTLIKRVAFVEVQA